MGLEAGTLDAWLHADDPTILQVSAAAASENGGEVGENAAEAQAWIDKWSSKNANQPDLECTGEYVNPRWESVEQVLSYSHKVGVRAPLTSERVNYKRVRRATDSGAGAMPITPNPRCWRWGCCSQATSFCSRCSPPTASSSPALSAACS